MYNLLFNIAIISIYCSIDDCTGTKKEYKACKTEVCQLCVYGGTTHATLLIPINISHSDFITTGDGQFSEVHSNKVKI